MARYHFDIQDGTTLVRDDEGTAFDIPDGAVQAVARSAAEIGTSRLAKGDFRDVVIEVRDKSDERVGTGHCHIDELYVSMPPLARVPNRAVSTTCAAEVHRQNGIYLLDVTMP